MVSISVNHLLVLLLVVPAAIGASDGDKGKMFGAGNGNLRRTSSIAWTKRPSSCFCSIALKNSMNQVRRRTGIAGDPVLSATKNSDASEATSQSFYERLHSPKHVLAPMVAQSDLPFRLMCEELYNVDMSYTQMIHAYNFVEKNGETFRTNHLDVYGQSIVRGIILGQEDRNPLLVAPSQINALKGLSNEDIDQSRRRILAAIAARKGTDTVSKSTIEVRPTVVQIAGHDPDVAVEAAMMILERSGSMAGNNGDISPVTAIDLNLGCPQSIARKGRYGSFLHDDSPDVTYSVLSKLRSKLPQEIGVTAKIRLPPTQAQADAGKLGNLSTIQRPQTIDERMRCLIDCGVDLITVHGRTRFENKVAVGAANWDAIRQCVDSARVYSGNDQFPVISNGGIEFGDDVKQCLDKTNASGVMSSESLLEIPGLFGSSETTDSKSAKDLLERQLGYASMYLDFATVIPPLPGSLGIKGGSFNVIRSHLFKILHRYLEENPDLRSWLGNQELNTIRQAKDLLIDLRSRYDNLDEEQLRLKTSWDIDSSWYRRHRQRNSDEQNEPAPSLSIEERKQLAKLRIQKMKEERMKKSMSTI
mmetsp:Transcript_16678/g.28690  ORF Transcript_16678/g.28690 Transcript_16678/m.28690 type:complete len:588 (+) Transcript_16678:61-1824(+)